MGKVTTEDIEGIKFAQQMDTVIAEIIEAVQSAPELREKDARLMASCFISMSAQCVLNMCMSKEDWLELCEIIYESHHVNSHLNQNSTSH